MIEVETVAIGSRREREARLAWEQLATASLTADDMQHLSKDTAETPNIDRRGVFFLEENQLGCSVPPGADVLRERTSPSLAYLPLLHLFHCDLLPVLIWKLTLMSLWRLPYRRVILHR